MVDEAIIKHLKNGRPQTDKRNVRHAESTDDTNRKITMRKEADAMKYQKGNPAAGESFRHRYAAI